MYLLSQMWIYLLLAFLIGLLAGWFWHRCTCNKAEIEAERDELKGKLAAALAGVGAGTAVSAVSDDGGWKARAEALDAELGRARTRADELAGRLAAVPAPVAAPVGVDQGEHDRLAWRARYLDARVKYLEGLDDAGAAGATVAAGLAGAGLGVAATGGGDATLKARIAELEADLAACRAGQGAAEITNANFAVSPVAAMSAADLEAAVAAAGDGVQPAGLPVPQGGKPDDLKELTGIGPKNEKWLHAAGIYHFWQIATLTVPGVAWLAKNLPNFGTRVYRENWVDQATKLARGEVTAGKAAYLRGDQA
jgi:predicted flap endonuclease-1-like 5' DNA nuclease